MDFKMGEELLYKDCRVIYVGAPSPTYDDCLVYGWPYGWALDPDPTLFLSPVMINKCLACGFTDKLYWIRKSLLRRVDA